MIFLGFTQVFSGNLAIVILIVSYEILPLHE